MIQIDLSILLISQKFLIFKQYYQHRPNDHNDGADYFFPYTFFPKEPVSKENAYDD